MATSEPALGALIPTGWGKGGGLSFLYVGITFGGDNHYTSAGIVVITTKSNSNKFQHYKAQICHDLDRTQNFQQFELATTILNPQSAIGNSNDAAPVPLALAQLVKGSLQSPNDFFEDTTPLQRDNQALHPLCTFANSHTAFHFNHHLSFKQMMVEEAAEKFCLSDLHPALVDFVSCYALENPASFTLIAISLIKVSQATHQCNAPNLSHLKCLKLPQTNANTVKHLKNFSTKIWVFLMTMQ